MTVDLNMFANDMDQATSDLSVTMTWSSQSITVVKDDVSRENDVQDVGVYLNADVSVWATIADFTGSVLPAVQDVVNIDGTNYSIRQKTISSEKVVVMLDCMRI